MKIVLSPVAAFKLERILEYLKQEWSEKVKRQFLEKLSSRMDQISSFPRSFRESQSMRNLYKCNVTKQTAMYYRIRSSDLIEIITIIDNRQDPKFIKNQIESYFKNDLTS